MDMNNVSSNEREPCRRLDFENCDNLNITNEVEFANMDYENNVDDRMSNHSTPIHANISEELIPKIGMEFESEEDAKAFYLSYAKAVGFGVRASKADKDTVTNLNLDRIFCCSKEGKRQEDVRDAGVRIHRAVTRCHCPAEMKISCRQTGKYRIVRFIDGHNHTCVTPSKSHLFPSHRKMSEAQKAQVDIAMSCGIAQRETMELLAKQVGGREHLGFISDDCKNYLRTKRKNKKRISETGGVLEYLQRKQAEDPNFFYSIQVDEDGLITNIFWTDARMRFDYSYFGDVVSFDTTYRKHKDGRPIALFVGVNSHKQTVVFGAALLYDETAATFSWLFDTFAIAMSNKKPETILTDQDKAMSKALASQWPETYHRLCVWHINQNAASHLGTLFAQHRDLAKDFSSCMFDHDYEDEFIDAWNEMIKKYNLQENQWLGDLFKIREKWALVYGRETFCADMCSTQRSESTNSGIKHYLNYDTELSEFFEHFERFVNDRRYKEVRADFHTDQSAPSLPFPVQILKHAASVYTHKIFELFQEEVCKSHDCDLAILGDKDDTTEFEVAIFGENYHHRVTYDSRDGFVSCGCKKFEFVGVLCSHALKVLNHKRVTKIPDQYIKKRWMKSAKQKALRIQNTGSTQVNPKEAMAYRYRELCQFHNQLIVRASESEKAYEIAKQGLKKLLELVDASFGHSPRQESMSTNLFCENANEAKLHGSNGNIDVSSKNVRGLKAKEKTTYKTSKRPKSGLEKATKKRKVKASLEEKKGLGMTTSSSNNNHGDFINESTFFQELHLENPERYSVATPYPSAYVVYHNQISSSKFSEESQIGVSGPNISDVQLFNSKEKQKYAGTLTDLLKSIDPNVNQEPFSLDYKSGDQLHGPNTFQPK